MGRRSVSLLPLLGLLAALLAMSPGCLKVQTTRHDQVITDRPLLTVGDTVLRYEDVGRGSPVLFIHGFGSTLETWSLVMPALCAHHRCIAADLPGFGRSSKYAGDYTPADQARALVGLLDGLGVDGPVDLVAHSYGCSVALALAEAYPRRVRRVVLSDGYVYADQQTWFLSWAQAPGVGEALFGLFYAQQLDWRMGLSFYDPHIASLEMVRKSGEVLDLPGTRAAALAVARGLDLVQSEKRYWHMDKPTLLLWGAEDQVTALRYGQRLEQHLPRAHLEVFPYAGHFPMVEAAARFAAQVGAFLDEEAP